MPSNNIYFCFENADVNAWFILIANINNANMSQGEWQKNKRKSKRWRNLVTSKLVERQFKCHAYVWYFTINYKFYWYRPIVTFITRLFYSLLSMKPVSGKMKWFRTTFLLLEIDKSILMMLMEPWSFIILRIIVGE